MYDVPQARAPRTFQRGRPPLVKQERGGKRLKLTDLFAEKFYIYLDTHFHSVCLNIQPVLPRCPPKHTGNAAAFTNAALAPLLPAARASEL